MAECDHKKWLAMSKIGGARIGARRFSAGGGRYEVYLRLKDDERHKNFEEFESPMLVQ